MTLVSLVMNLLAASVTSLSSARRGSSALHGPRALAVTAGVFQLAMCVLSYRDMDPLGATFCGFMALLSCQKSLTEGVYQLFFVAYLIAIAAEPLGFLQRGTQGQGLLKALVSKINALTLRTHDKDFHTPYLGLSKYADAEVLGHACSVLAAFAITATIGERGPLFVLVLPWAVVAGGVLQLLCGSVCFARDPFGTSSGQVQWYRGKQGCLPARTSPEGYLRHQIAEIMKNGGICGMPTDTVYVLVAACNRPDAVVKAYKVKKQAQDRPMSMWISSIKQLDPVKHLLSPLLLDFMEAAWPSSISMVIPRGPWLDAFGLGEAAKHIGTPQSIAIRSPDCTVATHLINMVGPIAVTSANPTGEADTTHHNQVYAKLGDKVNGVLCDGPSPENIASTVVDCTKIETGHIGFFRVGLIPKSKVLHIFEEVQRRHKHGKMNPAFEADSSESPMSDHLYASVDEEITEEPEQ
ncbi:unnamed protein product [Gadus morhua 'NCC']